MKSMALLHLFLIFLLPPPLLVSSSHGRRDLITCLISGGVTNFTTPNSPHYNHLLTISIQNLRYMHVKQPRSKLFNPVAVISPENETQVAVVVRCSQRRPFAILLRGGGHSFEALSSRADHHPFVIVDLANLNRVSLDADAGTAWVGGGATLGELYYSLAVSTSRRGFPAGMCPTVGVGGHFSGGGYGALARKYGLSSDNVVDVRMVDGRGRVLDRRAMGEDVFWAVRGGGGGTWGAIVGWKVGLVEVPERVTVFRVVKSGRSAMVAKLWEKWQVVASSEVDDDLFVQGLVFGGGGGSTGAVSLMFMGMNLQPKLPTLAAMAVFFPELNVTQQDCKEV